MKTATLLFHVAERPNPMVQRQSVYRMDPPHEGHPIVLLSTSDVPCSGLETYIFACDEKGRFESFVELDGSVRGTYSDEEVLKEIGYQIKELKA